MSDRRFIPAVAPPGPAARAEGLLAVGVSLWARRRRDLPPGHGQGHTEGWKKVLSESEQSELSVSGVHWSRVVPCSALLVTWDRLQGRRVPGRPCPGPHPGAALGVL